MKHIILLPTYNESENIEKIITKIFSLYPNIYIKVIDDRSPDGTADVVKKLLPKYVNLSLLSREGKQGLGRAYIHGFKEVIRDGSFSHLFMMDADMSHDPAYIGEMVANSGSFGLVIGSRYVKGGKTVGWEAWRKTLSFMGNLYSRVVTRMPVHDMTGGFNCISVNNLRKIDLDNFSSSGYAFIMELKFKLYNSGTNVKEIPIVFVNRLGGESKISNNIISEGILAPWKMIWKK